MVRAADPIACPGREAAALRPRFRAHWGAAIRCRPVFAISSNTPRRSLSRSSAARAYTVPSLTAWPNWSAVRFAPSSRAAMSTSAADGRLFAFRSATLPSSLWAPPSMTSPYRAGSVLVVGVFAPRSSTPPVASSAPDAAGAVPSRGVSSPAGVPPDSGPCPVPVPVVPDVSDAGAVPCSAAALSASDGPWSGPGPPSPDFLPPDFESNQESMRPLRLPRPIADTRPPRPPEASTSPAVDRALRAPPPAMSAAAPPAIAPAPMARPVFMAPPKPASWARPGRLNGSPHPHTFTHRYLTSMR